MDSIQYGKQSNEETLGTPLAAEMLEKSSTTNEVVKGKSQIGGACNESVKEKANERCEQSNEMMNKECSERADALSTETVGESVKCSQRESESTRNTPSCAADDEILSPSTGGSNTVWTVEIGNATTGDAIESESTAARPVKTTNGVRETLADDSAAAPSDTEVCGVQVALATPEGELSRKSSAQERSNCFRASGETWHSAAAAVVCNTMPARPSESKEPCQDLAASNENETVGGPGARSAATPVSNGGYVNQAFVCDSGKVPVKHDGTDVKREPDGEGVDTPGQTDHERRRVVRNVLVVSFAFLVHFTAYFGSANLQSSVNASEGLGTDSLVAVYAALIVSSFFLPATIIRRLGCKWTLVCSMCAYMPYICAQFAATRATLLPAAVLVGLGGGPLWCAKCSYLTAAARRFARIAKQQDEDIQVRFFGVFFTLFPLANVLGNAISSLVLTSGSDAVVASGVSCGVSFCPAEHDAGVNPNLQRPPLQQLYTLNGVFLACMVAAALAIAFLLDPLESSPEEEEDGGDASGLRLLTASARLLRDPLHGLVTPISIFFGVTQGFLGADFTQAYVSCSWGIPHIGYVLMCYGAVNCMTSAIISWLSKSVGRVLILSIYVLFYVPIIVTLFFWTPDPLVSTAAYFIFIAFWGATDSAFLVVNALYGILFRGHEKAAYSNFRVWESVGFIVSYAYSPLLCTHVKLSLMAALLAVSGGCYWCAEWLARRRAAANFWPNDKKCLGLEDSHQSSYKKPPKLASD